MGASKKKLEKRKETRRLEKNPKREKRKMEKSPSSSPSSTVSSDASVSSASPVQPLDSSTPVGSSASGKADETSYFERVLEEGEKSDREAEKAVLQRRDRKKLKLSKSVDDEISTNINATHGKIKNDNESQGGDEPMQDERMQDENEDIDDNQGEDKETAPDKLEEGEAAPPTGGAGNNTVVTILYNSLTVYMRAVSGEPLASMMQRKPIPFRKEFEDTFGKAAGVYPTQGSLRVVCKTTTQRAALLSTTNFMQRPVRVTPPHGRVEEVKKRSEVKGVIRGVSGEISDEEIREVLGAAGVIGARRIMRHEGDRSLPTGAIVLSFKGDQLPLKVEIGYLRYKVREYVPPVVRCYKCQGFSHKAANCKAGMRCVRCSGAHDFKDCPGKDNIKAVEVRCANCKGSHSAAFRECKGYLEVREALKIVTKERLSYKEALMKVRKVQKGVQPSAPKEVEAEAANRRGEVQQQQQQPPAGEQRQQQGQERMQQQVQQQQQQAQQSPGPRRKLVYQSTLTASPPAEPTSAKLNSPAQTKAVMTETVRLVQLIFRAMLGVVDAFIPVQSKPEFVAAAKDAVREVTGVQLPPGIPVPLSPNFISGFAPPSASGVPNSQSSCI